MTTQSIINEIERKVGVTNYSLWSIGVTNDPSSAKALFDDIDGNTRFWSFWETNNPDDVKNIINYFGTKGMRLMGITSVNGDSRYIYVY